MYAPFLQLSDWLCRGLSPFIARNKRLGQNFDERLVTSRDWAGEIQNCSKKIWIQAASLGEAQLASQLALELGTKVAAQVFSEAPAPVAGVTLSENHTRPSSHAGQIGLLLTSGTPEGRGELLKTQQNLLNCVVRLFPLFTQTYMRRALQKARPDLVILLETELWPGLMLACAETNTPLIILNARMSERSFKRYKLIEGLWKDFAAKGVPKHISAISEADAERYAYFFGPEQVDLMPNIKFDRAAVEPAPEKITSLKKILPSSETAPVLLLASVRTEEENQLAEVTKKLRAAIPGLLTLVVPKHLERSQGWLQRLTGMELPASSLEGQNNTAANVDVNPPVRLRSSLNPQQPARPGDVIVWDSVGELSALYGFAHSAFVGGSLAPLGGQNFLEALSQGVKPHIGPHWKNFAWVGRDLIAQDLVKEVNDAQELETSLLKDLRETKNRASRANVRQKFLEWLAQHQGGTKQAADLIRKILN